MRATLFERPGAPLRMVELPVPQAASGAVLVAVEACGVCRTDLHLIDGELPNPALPAIPGHEIVGRVAALGAGVGDLRIGQRVGVPWLGWTCGTCGVRRDGREFLALAPRVPIRTALQRLPLALANEALGRLRRGEFQGAAVPTMAR